MGKSEIYEFYCPTKGAEGITEVSLPAGEICPNPKCGRLKGKGENECNFVLKKVGVNLPIMQSYSASST